MSGSARQRDLFIATLGAVLAGYGVLRLVTEPFSWFPVLWLAAAVTMVGTTLRRALAARTAERRPPVPRPARRAGRAMAVASALFGVVLLAVALPRFARDGHSPALLALWATFAVAIVGFNLWTAFRRPRESDNQQVTPAARPPR
ncbi:hypothetical protein CO540_06880 [Micromonospora sp. WMMA2032]|uniref:hypothetical protein n=1 Tax=Micromonospora sp. WMMA2032 TaxID=2039870 RepID=UPI000C05978D|nr:hypothetical protein [Micromonospora sp. WMMA2032]ATO13591.1 hypothetical protein CO540_06880 [Micromonospora sp. WMMA2032]